MQSPTDLKAKGRGRAFLAALSEKYEGMRVDEEVLAVEAARLIDLAEELRKAVAEVGAVAADGSVSPALVELRMTRHLLRAVLKQLGLADEDGETDATRRARRAANVRHSRRA